MDNNEIVELYNNLIKEMGKFTKDKRVRKTNQYSNNVHHIFYSNVGYLLPKS